MIPSQQESGAAISVTRSGSRAPEKPGAPLSSLPSVPFGLTESTASCGEQPKVASGTKRTAIACEHPIPWLRGTLPLGPFQETQETCK